jgi:hypothetical protein
VPASENLHTSGLPRRKTKIWKTLSLAYQSGALDFTLGADSNIGTEAIVGAPADGH